jgi:uncharacterized protein (TIGR03382 family)
VTVEAQFEVGEYEIVILSAKDSAGLETWLKQEKYTIPDGAEPYLRPYVEAGSKFFVAKVNAKKVSFKDGQVMLSPLRFHYDSKDFVLPVRLGMMNSEGTQDLIVHILAQNQRYEVANYPNVTIPTNIDVREEARDRFGEFYAALFDSTLEKNKGAVVTEYSWSAASCDPCPSPPLSWSDIQTLGYDVIGGAGGGGAAPGAPVRSRRVFGSPGGFTLTRLHTRYSKGSLGEDLVFKAAPPIVGGREFLGEGGKLEHGARPGGINNFQGRYAIRHEWEGPIECENPQRGIWGGPPSGQQNQTRPATDLAFVKRGGLRLRRVVKSAIPELGIAGAGNSVYDDDRKPEKKKADERPMRDVTEDKTPKGGGCSTGGPAGMPLVLIALGWIVARRRRVGEGL